MNPRANKETERRLIGTLLKTSPNTCKSHFCSLSSFSEELRPKKPSPRINVTSDGEAETIDSPKSETVDSPKSSGSGSDSARRTPREDEYEYEEVYEEVEEWEYEGNIEKHRTPRVE